MVTGAYVNQPEYLNVLDIQPSDIKAANTSDTTWPSNPRKKDP